MSIVEDIKNSLSGVFNRADKTSSAKEAPYLSQRMNVMELPEPPDAKMADYLGAMRGWVYVAVNAIAQEVSKIDLVLYRKRGGKIDIVDDHEMLELIDRVNPFTTKNDLIYATQAYLELVGESFWWKYKEGGVTKQIWILRPDFVEILPPKQTGDYIGGYKYKVPGMKESAIYKVDEVMHFKEFDPMNPYRGLGRLQASAYAYDTDFFASKWNRNFFYNNAMPTTLLTTEQNLKKKDIDRIRTEWQNKFGGVNKAHKMAILTGGLKVDDVLKQSIRDMDFLNLRKFSRDEIFTIFQVPKTIVAITEDVNRSNAREGKAVWIENVIKPKMSRLVSFLNEFLAVEWGDEYYFGYHDPSPENVDMNLKLVEIGKGILTINERRELLDYDPIEGGDEIQQAIPFGGEENEDDKKGGKDSKVLTHKITKRIDDGVIVSHKRTVADQIRRKVKEAIKEKGVDELLKEIVYLGMNNGKDERVEEKKNQHKEEVGVVNQEKREGFWKAMVLRSEPQEVQFGISLKLFWDKQRKNVIDRIQSGKSFRRRKSVDGYLYESEEENNILVNLIQPLLEKIIAQAGEDAFKLLGLSESFQITEEVLEELRKYGLLMAESINTTTREQLREALAEGVSQQESVPQLSKRVMAVYDEADKNRASMIARTETMRANNLGHLEAYKQSGVVDMKEWMVALDERTCQYCLAMEKEYKQVGLGEDFISQGQELIGLDGGTLKIDYSGLSAPPLHPQCRCVLLPVVRLSGKGKAIKTQGLFEEVKVNKNEL